MKKIIAFALSCILVCSLVGCGAKPAAQNETGSQGAPGAASSQATASTEAAASAQAQTEVAVDYGSSELFTKQDMDAAMDLIEQEFNTWEGCELHSISYTSDEECNSENIAWMNEQKGTENEQFTQCIKFLSTFHSPKEGGGAWEADKEYTDYEWWLARAEGGEWTLVTWGY